MGENYRRKQLGDLWFKPIRVAGYARVSSQLDAQSCSLQNQIEYYHMVMAKYPNWVNLGMFFDRTSGLHMSKQTNLNHLLQMSKDHQLGIFQYITDALQMEPYDQRMAKQKIRVIIFFGPP